MLKRKFTRTIEDFKCNHCEYENAGNGYTNHCVKCLWSKHVDINPGDRSSTCGGLMGPSRIEQKSGEFTIIHRCVKCGFEKRNKSQKNDDIDELLRISMELAH